MSESIGVSLIYQIVTCASACKRTVRRSPLNCLQCATDFASDLRGACVSALQTKTVCTGVKQPVTLRRMVVGSQDIRAGRGLLGWRQIDLADKSGVSKNALSLIERSGDARTSTLRRLARALEAAGVEFVPGGGVRLRKP